jgi:formimidoylglutamate deiminase
VLTLDAFAELVRDLAAAYGDDPQIALGVAPHSLRAVGIGDLAAVVALADAVGPQAPIHMHASEQEREVAASIEAHGVAPIELLARYVELDPRWCLVHCTHATPAERHTIAERGVVVGLCPTTEASLGDGIFPATTFVRAGGRIAIGTDSNVSIDVAEELRWLEYVQRLAARERNLMHSDRAPFVGRYLYETALRGGAQVSGRAIGALETGRRADFIAVECAGNDPETALGVALFRSRGWRVTSAVAGGKHVVRDGVCTRR